MDIVTSDDAFEDKDIKYVFYCKSSSRCAGFLTCVMLMVLPYSQISKMDSATSDSHSLNTRKSFKSDHTIKSGQFGDDF